MEVLSQKRRLLLGCFLSSIIFLSVTVSGLQTSVCPPSSASQPLACTSNQWVRIRAEIYVPQTDPGPACQPNISSCNAYFYDTGMLTNCNGPAGRAPCREEVDVAAARRVTTCLHDVTDVATLIQYDCIEGSSVLSLCDANATIWTSNLPLYLASPGYVQSTPVGKMCTCNIQGSDLKMNAVEINVLANLPWDGEVTEGSSYSDMFAVTSGNTSLWRSGNCAGCSSANLVNSNLFLPTAGGTRYADVTVDYSDFGVSGQHVWVEIFESGPSISVSCRSTSLPSNRVITTSTTTTTTSTTAPTTSTLAATTSAGTTGRPTSSHMSASSPEDRTVTVLTETAASPTAKITRADLTATPSSAGYSRTTDAGKLNSGEQDDSSDEVTLIATLTVILCVLVVVATVLGVLIYRKRHNFKSVDYTSPWDLVVACYYRNFRHKPRAGGHQDVSKCGNFDSVLGQDASHQQHPCRTVSEAHIFEKPSTDNAGSVQNCDANARHTNGPLIPRELYELHQQLLDKEVDKMRRERSSKASQNIPTNVPLDARFINNRSLDACSTHESDTARPSQQRHSSANDTTNKTNPDYQGTTFC